jgi:hypothetical protein
VKLQIPPLRTSLLSKNISRKSIHTEISQLRCAPVEMTKGRAVLPGTVVDGQKLFFITLGGRAGPMTSPVEMTKGRVAADWDILLPEH